MDLNKWRTRHVKGQGDCLFDSIRIALQSIGYKYTIADLRHAVAKRVLDRTDEEMTNTIEMWIEIYQEYLQENQTSLLAEYFQVATVRNKKNITDQDRISIYNDMMMSMFWGEETSLRTLERALYTKFLIFSYGQNFRLSAMQPTSSGETFPYNTFIVLCLNGNHYQPMSYEGKFVFLKNSLPNDVKELFQIYI